MMSNILLKSANTLTDFLTEMKIIWIPLIVALLSSSVIVGVFQFIQWNKNKKLENITVERKSWRDDLRKIAEGLQKSEDNNSLQLALTKLKVRINPKGIFPKKIKNMKLCDKIDYFQQDTYLWEIIKMIEEATTFKNKKSFIPYLVELISLLIKFDWDRAKSEIKFSNVSKAKIWFYLFFTCILVHIFAIALLSGSICFFFVALLLYIPYPLLIPYMRYRITVSIAQDKKVEKKIKSKVKKIVKNIKKIVGKIKKEKVKSWLHLNNQITTFIFYLILLILLSVVIIFDCFNFIEDKNYLLLIIQGSCSIFTILFYFSTTHFANISKYCSVEYYYTIVNEILKNAKTHHN